MAELRAHPAWFGVVMGTAAVSLSLAAQQDAWDLGWLGGVAVAFLLLASVLGILLTPRYVARVARRGALRQELADPGHGAMLATFPAGILLLAVGWGRVGPQVIPTELAIGVGAALAMIGIVVALAVGILWAAAIASGTSDLASVHGGWLIPPVMTLIVPLALLPVAGRFPAHAAGLVLLGFAFLGVGALLFVAILTLLIARLAFRPPLPAQLAPSLLIPLAPAGVLGFATLRLLQAGNATGTFDVSPTAGVLLATMGVGFGLWWALFAATEHRRLRAAGIPFHPGWWGYVFPVAAMALSITAIGAATAVTPVVWFGATGTAGLVVLWAVVAARTVGLLARSR